MANLTQTGELVSRILVLFGEEFTEYLISPTLCIISFVMIVIISHPVIEIATAVISYITPTTVGAISASELKVDGLYYRYL